MVEKVYMDEKAQNLNQALLAAMDTFAERTCFRGKRGRRYFNVSYRRFQKLAFRLVSFLNQYGLSQGECVAIIADNSMEWMVAYVACLLSGGVAVPLPTSLSPDVLQFVLRDCGARLAVVQDEHQGHILDSMLGELPELDTVLAMNKDQGSLLGAFPMAEVLSREIPLDESEAIRSRARSVEPQALATIYYTSGQADRPRGAVFDHAQRLLTLQYISEWFTLGEDDLVFSMHPWGYARSLDIAVHCFLSGVANFAENPNESYETMIEDMLQTGPTIALVTPAHFEVFYNSVLQEISELPEASRQLFHWALAKGREYRAAGPEAAQELREQHDRAFMTFFGQIKGRVGGRLRRIYSVGAQVSDQLLDFAEAIGMLMLNVYHVTDAGGFPTVSLPDAYRAGSCGQVAPGFQVRIADDEEVLIRSETVMRQYWQQPEETRRVITADGWLHTGDLGHFDRDGYLYLTGRKQSLIVLSTSQRVIPTNLEEALVASPFISQAAVFGDGRLYVSALILPDMEAVVAAYRDRGSGAEPSPAQVKALLDKVIKEVNSQLRPWEQIREYRVVAEPLTPVSGELEASTEINRQAMAERYAHLIEAMYPDIIQPQEGTVTQVEIEPEHLRELLEKQEVLDVWIEDAGIGFLFDLARAKGIDVPSMVHICETVVAIAYMQNEEKPLSTALIVGDPADIAHVLPTSEIQLNRYDHIRRMRQVMISLSRLVDGTVLGYGVDKHGYIRGIHKLEVDLAEAGSFLLGQQARHHAAISRACKAIVFFVPPGGRQARVFANGELVGRYANGSWSPESIPRIDAAVARLAEQKQYDLGLLQRLLRCAFQMSEQNLGAIFVVGDADSILGRSDPPEISAFASIADADMQELSEGELINFAKQDGATVVDAEGRLRGCMVLLRPAAETQAEIGVGKGARHSSAAKISAEEQCLAITVSQDGPITVYDSGQRMLSL
jgi:long-chain acyl-CoA synthetase